MEIWKSSSRMTAEGKWVLFYVLLFLITFLILWRYDSGFFGFLIRFISSIREEERPGTVHRLVKILFYPPSHCFRNANEIIRFHIFLTANKSDFYASEIREENNHNKRPAMPPITPHNFAHNSALNECFDRVWSQVSFVLIHYDKFTEYSLFSVAFIK